MLIIIVWTYWHTWRLAYIMSNNPLYDKKVRNWYNHFALLSSSVIMLLLEVLLLLVVLESRSFIIYLVPMIRFINLREMNPKVVLIYDNDDDMKYGEIPCMKDVPRYNVLEAVISVQDSQYRCLGDPYFVHFIRDRDAHQYCAAPRTYFVVVYRCVHAIFL